MYDKFSSPSPHGLNTTKIGTFTVSSKWHQLADLQLPSSFFMLLLNTSINCSLIPATKAIHFLPKGLANLTRHTVTLTSVCIFSILFSIHFLKCWWGDLVGDLFLYSSDLKVWLGGGGGEGYCKEKLYAGHS